MCFETTVIVFALSFDSTYADVRPETPALKMGRFSDDVKQFIDVENSFHTLRLQ